LTAKHTSHVMEPAARVRARRAGRGARIAAGRQRRIGTEQSGYSFLPMDKPTITMRSIFGDRPPALRRRGVKAWLLEWVASPFDAKKLAGVERDSVSAQIAGILSPRLTWQAAYDVARAIYFAQRVEPAAMLAFRDVAHEDVSPFMAVFPFTWEQRLFPRDEKLYRGPWHAWFLLGGTPGIYARTVEGLRTSRDGALHWTELAAPPTVPSPNVQGQ
jgi:hypothetical protein